jgi:hypothetical protein
MNWQGAKFILSVCAVIAGMLSVMDNSLMQNGNRANHV